MMMLTLPMTPALLTISIEPTERRPVQIDLSARLDIAETLESAACADGGRGIGSNVAAAGTTVQLDVAGLINGTLSLLVITALGDAGSVIRCVLVVRCIDPASRLTPVIVPPTGALIMRDEYVEQGIYRQYDVVSQGGVLWFSLVDSPSSVPGIDANEWAPLGGSGSTPQLIENELAAVQNSDLPSAENPFITASVLEDLVTALAEVYAPINHSHAQLHTAGSDSETVSTMGALINSSGAISTPAAADVFSLRDSVSGLLVKLSWTNLLVTAKAYFDTIYATITSVLTKRAVIYSTVYTADFTLTADMLGTTVLVVPASVAGVVVTFPAWNGTGFGNGWQCVIRNAYTGSETRDLVISGTVVAPSTKLNKKKKLVAAISYDTWDASGALTS